MGDSFRLGFCASGNGYLVRAAILQRHRLGVEPSLVVGETSTSRELEEFCDFHNVPFVRIARSSRSEFDNEVQRVCVDAQLDLLSLSTFNKIVPPGLVQHYSPRIINCHPALLPAFKGFHGFQESASSDARFFGMTIHEVTESVDDGPIIAQTIVATRRGETTETLGKRIYGQLRLMYLQVVSWYVQNRVEHDDSGHIYVRDAVYGELPTSPSVEESFPD